MGVNDAGVPGRNLPASEDHVMRRLADLERAYRELGPSVAKSFAPVIADLTAKQIAIEANLASINDLLTKVVASDIVNTTNTGFAVTTAWSDAAATTITVPTGFTQLLATCSAEVFAVNPNTTGGSNGTGGDALDCHVLLNGSTSAGFAWGMSGSNGFTSASSSGSFKFTGLTPGATLQISTQVLALYQALGSNVANKATINATLIWLR